MIGVGSMGPVTMTSSELRAWQECSGIELTSWEFQTVRDMSRAYVSQLHDSEDPACPPPVGEQTKEFDRGTVSKKVGSVLKSFMTARK